MDLDLREVRLGSKADIGEDVTDVRFAAGSGHRSISSRPAMPGEDIRLTDVSRLPNYGYLNNRSEHLPNSSGQSHRQRPPKHHSGGGAENICAARSCPDCTEKRKKA